MINTISYGLYVKENSTLPKSVVVGEANTNKVDSPQSITTLNSGLNKANRDCGMTNSCINTFWSYIKRLKLTNL